MKNIFEKNETLWCMILIFIYLTVNSFCLQNFGIASIETVVANSIFSIFLVILMIILKKIKYYGLTKAINARKYLYFTPLILLATQNLWSGVNLQTPINEIILYVFTMVNIGFIEEVIFRGFLFKMMEKSDIKVAIWVNALTFGFGHILNLLNGADMLQTLFQICSATAIGYLFVIIFYKSKSIIPAIITHIFINSTSILGVRNMNSEYLGTVISVLISIGYAIYINSRIKDDEAEEGL